MNNIADPLLNLRDIAELQEVSWFPLSITIWSFLAAFSAIICIILLYFIIRKSGWKLFIYKKLSNLNKNLKEENARQILTSLSEILRYVAMRNFSRRECANLTGKDFLNWLTLNDPKQYNWHQDGHLLISANYAPKSKDIPIDQLKNLIKATMAWVK